MDVKVVRKQYGLRETYTKHLLTLAKEMMLRKREGLLHIWQPCTHKGITLVSQPSHPSATIKQGKEKEKKTEE